MRTRLGEKLLHFANSLAVVNPKEPGWFFFFREMKFFFTEFSFK